MNKMNDNADDLITIFLMESTELGTSLYWTSLFYSFVLLIIYTNTL